MIYRVKEKKQESWEISFSRYEGMQKNAVDFLNTEFGQYVIREKGIHTFYVLPIRQEDQAELTKNALILGLFSESKRIREFVDRKEIPENGYLVKVLENPKNPDFRYVILTANDEQNLYYAAVSFMDEYPVRCAPVHGGLRIPDEVFDYVMPTISWTGRAKVRKRSIFAWGHPISDYRSYIRNMARLKLNQLIIWNDYLPLNAREIVEYAHKYQIELIWGYAWGWNEGCKVAKIDPEYFQKLKESVLDTFEQVYKDFACDGIYFQSITELPVDEIGGVMIAKAVTDFVNETSNELMNRYPSLHIQFGLHASSVKDHLEEIANVEKRVEILWEDCGTFPFAYIPAVPEEEKWQQTLEFTKKILTLRPGAETGLVFKGFMTLDWEQFRKQAGPYILGENAESVRENDRKMRASIWRVFQGEWMQNGKYAQQIAELACKITNGNVNLCMAGVFDGGIMLPEAICSQIFWDPTENYEQLIQNVASRLCITNF